MQITLDGTEQTYNRVKAYVHQGVDAFERVLQNIAMLTAAGIHVSIRLNVDKHNIREMAELVRMSQEFLNNLKKKSPKQHIQLKQRIFAKTSPCCFSYLSKNGKKLIVK